MCMSGLLISMLVSLLVCWSVIQSCCQSVSLLINLGLERSSLNMNMLICITKNSFRRLEEEVPFLLPILVFLCLTDKLGSEWKLRN